MNNRRVAGFTIVELLIVVVVIAILAALALVAYVGISDQARVSGVEYGVRQAYQKVLTYKASSSTEALPVNLTVAGYPQGGSSVGNMNYSIASYSGLGVHSGKYFCVSSIEGSVSRHVWNLDGQIKEGMCNINAQNTAAVDRDDQGNYYVVNYGYDWLSIDGSSLPYYHTKMAKYDANKTLVWVKGGHGSADGMFDSGYFPWGIFVDPDGNVWVADSGNHRFQKFDSDGNFLLKIGGPTSGSAVGSFNTPYGAAFTNDGHVWLSDRYNHRILKYTLAGAHVSTVTSSGSLVFNQPHGMYIDQAQNIYVVSRGNHRAYKLNSSGGLLTTYGSGTGDANNGSINSPTTLLVDPSNGDVYIYEVNNKRISVFSNAGAFIRNFSTTSGDVTLNNRSFGMIWEGDDLLLSIQNSNDVRFAKYSKAGVLLETTTGEVIKS